MFRPGLTLTVNNAKSVLEAGLHAIQSGETVIDLSDLTAIDSAAMATLLAWRRAAEKRGQSLTIHHSPANLQSLAELYGVAELLHLGSPVSSG